MKTTMIIKGSLFPAYTNPVAEKMHQQPFSLMMDESNNRYSTKCLVILACIFEDVCVKTRMLNLPELPSGKASTIFEAVDSFMSIGCICHLANLCVKAGVKAPPFKVNDLLVDVFYFFNHSSKRIQDFKEFQQFTEVEEQQILKYCPTRWLSLEKVCNCLLSQLLALRSYFASHKDVEKPGKVKSINDRLQEPLTELILLFLQYIMSVLNQFNILFQGEDCMVGSLLSEMDKLLRKFLELKHVKSCKNLREFDVGNQELQQSDDKLAVGPTVRSHLVELEEDLDAKTVQVFSVRGFYEAAARKMMDKFPFDNEVLVNLAVLDPSKKDELDYSGVVNLTSSFGFYLDLEQLKEEWEDFQLMPFDVVPCRANDGKKNTNRCILGKGLRCKNCSGCCQVSSTETTFYCFAVPPTYSSNSNSERAFSLVRKIHTEYRKNMAADTLAAYLQIKINCDEELQKGIRFKFLL